MYARMDWFNLRDRYVILSDDEKRFFQDPDEKVRDERAQTCLLFHIEISRESDI
jgi:hypothetical protein